MVKDDIENINESRTIYFYIKAKETQATSTLTIAVISVIAVTCTAGVITYIKKYRR